MTQIIKFLDFQRKQQGVLTIDDAAKMTRVDRATVHTWALRSRVAFVRYRGRRYFGYESLREWSNLSAYAKNFKTPEQRKIDRAKDLKWLKDNYRPIKVRKAKE